jgi:hypothetical protein
MEIVPIVLVTGAFSYMVAKKKCDNKRVSLPSIMCSESSKVSLLVVHVGEARLVPRLVDANLRLRVKYGEQGSSVHCDTTTVVPERPASAAFVANFGRGRPTEKALADFDAQCLFAWHPSRSNVLRFRLAQEGHLCAHTVAKGELRIERHAHFGKVEKTICLKGDVNEDVIAYLTVSVQALQVQKDALQACMDLINAEQQDTSFLATCSSCAFGRKLCDDELSPDSDAVGGTLREPWPIVRAKTDPILIKGVTIAPEKPPRKSISQRLLI